MGKYLPVSDRQTGSVRQMANDKKIGRGRFQQALDDGSFSRFLDSFKIEAKNVEPPRGARIYILRVNVKQDREWQAAVEAAGPNNPRHYDVREIGGQYPPVGKGTGEEELILLNFPKGDGSWDRAIEWAEAKGLTRTNPREVFAIGEFHPILHQKLRRNPMYLVATTDCNFEGRRHAFSVGWLDSIRHVFLRWVGSFDSSGDWFAFRK